MKAEIPVPHRQHSANTRFKWLSLRLFLPLAMLVLVVLARFYTYETALVQDRQEVLADMQRSQSILASRLQVVIEDGLREQELEDIQKYLSILGDVAEIKTALLANEHGKVIAALEPATVGSSAEAVDPAATLAGSPAGRTWVSPERNLILSAYPVAFNPTARADKKSLEKVGVLFVASDPAPMQAEREALTRNWMNKTNWLVAALALLAWLLVHFLVSRRIGRLMQTVDAFGKHIAGTAPALTGSGVAGRDEIGRLGKAFDEMMLTQERYFIKARMLTQAVEQSAASVIITDRTGAIEYVNAAFTEITGYTRQEVLGKKTNMLSAGQTSPEVYKDLWETISAGKTWRGEMLNRRKNGETYWDSVIINPVLAENGNITHFVAVQEDITERKKAEQTLLLNAHILNNVSEGIAVTDSEQKFCFVNPAFTAITGYSPEEVIGKSPRLLSSGLMEKTFYGKMWGNINDKGRWQGEIIDRRKNGESYPEWLSISSLKDENGITSHYISVFADISERKAVEQRISHMAQHDFLTGLPNRMLLLDRMEQAITHARRDGRKVAVMFLDLDRFKTINDMLGHVVGDKLLHEVASRISRISRAGDTVCRLGGDEFVVMLPDIGTADDVSGIAEKLLESVAGASLIGGHEIEITVSIGISIFPDDGVEGNALLQHADAAMYYAKQSGRNNYHFFTSEMNRRALERMTIERKLRHALERGEFTLHYQPQIDLRTGRMVGAEALVRWRDPESGEMIQPGRFVPIAEENGMIVPIGEWVLREACRQMAEWRRMGLPEIVMAVNLSAVQFRQKNLGENVREILRQHGIAPSLLELEITETAVMQDAEAAIVLLNELKEMGVQLAMDDFGTGYSSLSHLKRLPIDKLKIDQSFVHDIVHDPDDASIVSTIISMARNLKLRVIAEGVETGGQLSFLNQHGCDEGQGYYFARPMQHGEFVAYFNTHLKD